MAAINAASKEERNKAMPKVCELAEKYGTTFGSAFIGNAIPLDYDHRDAIIKEFATQKSHKRMSEKYVMSRALTKARARGDRWYGVVQRAKKAVVRIRENTAKYEGKTIRRSVLIRGSSSPKEFRLPRYEVA